MPDPPPSTEAQELVRHLNRARQAAGLSPLTEHPLLSRLARRKAEDISRHGYWDHLSPALGAPTDMLRQEGLSSPCVGENLAWAPGPRLAHVLLMGSLAHRFNILCRHFTHVGVGVAPWPRGGRVYVELFARLGVEGAGRSAYHGGEGTALDVGREARGMTYEYRCRSCDTRFEVRATLAEKERGLDPACPACGAREARRVFTSPLFLARAGGNGEPAPNGSASGGGCSCGGACSCGA